MENMNYEELQNIVSICIDEIIQLKEENAKLKEQIAQVINNQVSYMKSKETIIDNISTQVVTLERAVDNVKYELNDPRFEAIREALKYPAFYDIDITIDMLVNKRCSIARFGDGEFAIMSNVERQKFQRIDTILADKLKHVLASEEEGLLIAIADNYGDLSKYNRGGKLGIRRYMTEEVRAEHGKYLDMNRTYHNAYVSRPYALFADNITEAPKQRFDALKRIWDQRKVIFVEGELTRLGVGNDLFDNAKQIRRILAPAINAFDKYDEILKASLKCAEDDVLFLIALGPTAGVLAYDLYKAGYQAIDIGHVDLEYEWYLRGTGGRCEVKNKYNNEFPEGDVVETVHDKVYEQQILCRC